MWCEIGRGGTGRTTGFRAGTIVYDPTRGEPGSIGFTSSRPGGSGSDAVRNVPVHATAAARVRRVVAEPSPPAPGAVSPTLPTGVACVPPSLILPEKQSEPARVRGYGDPVTTQVIVLNGGSSSGKSGLVRCLQAVLPEPWLAFAIDTFVDSLPASLRASLAGIEFAPDGTVTVGPEFSRLERAWMEGVAATARAGAPVIVDDVFLGGADSQSRWRKVLTGLDVLWVGVHCAPAVAAGREIARGDRPPGMAERQAELVHRGVVYDMEVDTTHTESLVCARTIADALVTGSR